MKKHCPQTASLLLLIITALLLPACVATSNSSSVSKTSNTDGIFIHLSSGKSNPHAVLMALKMADNFASTNPVIVYCDVQSIDILLKDAPPLSTSNFLNSQELIEKLLSQNVPIYACPSCLKSHKKIPSDLIPGIQIASKSSLTAFTTNRILSFSY
ncbi:DsrE family protein [Poriferisphaera corsica]|uniref:DsrE family protein n=1 Tax=Poriferisphaera corsica TaxID=2528020 RepID=UPI00119F0856|nr:DsrE family protein [Poriferisphaera corsica]